MKEVRHMNAHLASEDITGSAVGMRTVISVNRIVKAKEYVQKHSTVAGNLLEPKKKKYKKRKSIGNGKRFNVLNRDNFTCTYCGRSRDEDNVKLEIDHIVPVTKGGTNSEDNLTTSCYECNRGKGVKLLNKSDKSLRLRQAIYKQKNKSDKSKESIIFRLNDETVTFAPGNDDSLNIGGTTLSYAE